MIFKTINSSVDETRKTLALFNKDWNTYKRNWQNANGVFGKIGSVFTPANAITKSDIEAIKAYNSQIDSCVTSQTAFNRTMLNASPAAQNLVASYNGGKVSAQGMATAQNAAKASTIRLTIAQTALNAAIGMGIGLLISLVVKGIDKLVHANEEAIEKAEELRRKYEEFKSTNESNVTTLNGLKKEFEELSKGVSQYGDNISLTTEQYERYKEIIQQIVGMSPSLAKGYSTENGYIADKNGLLERAIELQEQEYRNELRKITNLDNLKTSMSGYIAEYKEAFDGGFVTDDMSATATKAYTNLKNALYDIFNTNNRDDFSSENMIKQIMDSIGIKDIEAEMAKYYNKYGYFQDQDFWNDYADVIAQNIQAITNSLNADVVGLDDTVFDQNIEKVDSAAQSYLDMKDAISIANESIQRDLGYIAEYADGYSNLSTEQQKFVYEFLKGYDISDIMSESNNPFDQGWKFDEDKIASVKSQITKFVEALSQDESTKTALADLYAIPTDEQSISEFIEQFRNALEVIKAHCQENGIEIPIAIIDSEQTINDLEAQYQRAVDFAKDKFDGYDPTAFFKEHSINTQEEIDAWQEIAQGARDAAEAEREYIQNSTLNDTPISLNLSTYKDQLSDIQSSISTLRSALDSLNSGDLSKIEVIDLMQKFPELAPYIDLTADGFGNLSEGLSKLMEQQPSSLINELEKLKASLNTDEEREQVDLLIDSLQRLSSYGDSGIEAYAASMGNTWTDTKNVIDGVVTQFENLAKVQEAVSNGLTMSAMAATELAKIYPEILTNATVTADGQMKLNEEVVKNILAGDQSIINAQIAKLEADKAGLEAKQKVAIAELEIAKNVGTAKGQITEEEARNQIEALEAELQAELDKDKKVVDSYATATESKMNNASQFNTHAGQVASDVATNMLNAAVSMATNIKVNAENSQQSLTGIGHKAAEVAKSIIAMSAGESVDVSDKIFQGKGGTKSGAIKIVNNTRRLSSATRKYLDGNSDLEDFKSQLEIDIQGYTDAISNIDSQINVLKNLQATFTNVDGTGIGGHGYADKIKDLEKEKDKISKALDDAKSGGGSAGDTKDEYEELFDFFEQRIKVLSAILSLLKSGMDNVIGSFAKNSLIDAQLNVTEEKFNNYTDALAMYTQKANEALSELPTDIAQKIKDGAVDLTTFIGEGNEGVVEAIKVYQTWADKVSDCRQELEELKTSIRQLELDKFNNIAEDFTNQFNLHKDGKDLISKQIDLLKEAGELIGESFFTTQIDQSKKQLEVLENEKEKLVEQMSSAISSGRVDCCPLL